MALKDKLVNSGIPTVQPLTTPKPSYTLTDLRNDDEFTMRSERYLKSLGEGDNVDNMFQYFRGSDLNLYDTHKVYRQSKEFTDEQKEDYIYLKNKFDNARIGGLKEKLQLGVDATQEIVSDPTILASAFFVPWTGGASAAGRLAMGAAAKTGLKSMVASNIAKGQALNIPKGVLTAGQVLSKPLSNKAMYGVLAAEGALYSGTFDYVTQDRQLELGLIDEKDLVQTGISATVGAIAGPALLGAGRGLAKIPKKVKQIEEVRVSNIDNNENYKPTLIERGNQKLLAGTYGMLGLIPLKPTTVLLKKAEKSPYLLNLLKLFRYDAAQGFVAPKIGSQETLAPSYDEVFRDLVGSSQQKVNTILRSYKSLWTYDKANVALPFSAGHFLNPLRSKTTRTRKSLKFRQSLTQEANDDLAYYLRSGNISKIVEVSPNKFKQVKLSDDIISAGKQIRKELDNTLNRAQAAGIKIGSVKQFFPRFWRTDVIKNNKDEFIELIKRGEGLNDAKATELWEELATEGSEVGSSAVNLNARIKQSRRLTKINDARFGKFLDNDVRTVLDDYFAEASKLIIRTEMFGETEGKFSQKWINKIQRQLGKNKLTTTELEYLKDLYNYTTGVKGKIDTSTPLGKLGQGFSDFLTITMQTSMLAFSTLTSVAEIGVPLLKGSPVRPGMNAMLKGIGDSTSEWWKSQKVNYGPYLEVLGKEFKQEANLDIRSQNRQDLNSFYTSVDSVKEDRLMAIYGQAVGKRATNVQNAFFKTIGLHQWTRYVQLVGYDMGKSIIYRNLKQIDDYNKGIIKNTKTNEVNMLRLKDELAELNVDMVDGLKWINKGAKHTDDFYNNVKAGAARYTNEVVMNPTSASAQKPLLHSRPVGRVIYGLMGFPTAFSNTVLRNFVRNFTRDGKTLSSGGSKVSAVNAVTAAMFMTQVGMLNHTIRTGGRNLEQYENGELTARDLILKGMSYSGLMGPMEMYYRYGKSKRYESNITAAIGSAIGPNVPDIIDYISMIQSRGSLAEVALRRAPFSMALKSSHPDIYEEVLTKAREIDKKLFAPDREKELKQVPFAKGGIVEGEDNVPYTKEDPADRINPYTGQPYKREQRNIGGRIISKEILKLIGDTPSKKVKSFDSPTLLKPVDENKHAYEVLGIDDEFLKNWKIENAKVVKQRQEEFGINDKLKRNPKISQALKELSENEIDYRGYKRIVEEESPVKLFEDVPEPASYTDIAAALQDNKLKKGLVYLNKNIPEDTTVGLRLDIPAYKDHDVWVASIHLPKGEGTTYGKTGWIKDVTFGDAKLSQKSFEIASGKNKSPIAQMTGKWKNHTPGDAYRQAKEFLNDKEWTQVGYNPFKFGYFYDRLTMNPVIAADEVIQVGPFVIAKNVTTALPTDKRFEIKTKDGNRFNFEKGGTVSTNEQMDRLGFDKGGENIFSKLIDSIKEKVPAPARLYYDKVIRQDKNPITEKDFTEKEYQNIKNHFKETLINDIKSGKIKFDNQGNAQYIRQDEKGRTFTKPVISGYRSVEKNFEPSSTTVSQKNKEALSDLGLLDLQEKLNKSSDGNVKDFTNVFGEASYSFKKDGYENSTASIDDVYDFNFTYAGGYNPEKEKAGILNTANRRKYLALLNQETLRGSKNQNIIQRSRPLLERYAAFRLPDEKTSEMLEQDYQPVNVKVNIPIQDIFTKDEWSNLFGSEQTRQGLEEGGPVLPEYRGRDAYEKAIQKFAESEKDAQLLREFAWVESKFADDPTTFRKDNRSAYQITPIRFQDFKDSLNDNSKTGAGLRRYINKMEKKYNTNYRDIKYDDLNNPEIGTIVTRALLKRVPEPIGDTKEQRAVQWKRDWNTELGAGTVEKYLTDLKYLD
jgi:hypothetical protein